MNAPALTLDEYRSIKRNVSTAVTPYLVDVLVSSYTPDLLTRLKRNILPQAALCKTAAMRLKIDYPDETVLISWYEYTVDMLERVIGGLTVDAFLLNVRDDVLSFARSMGVDDSVKSSLTKSEVEGLAAAWLKEKGEQ